MGMGLEIEPCSLADANAFVLAHHRHHGKVVGHKFSIGITDNLPDGPYGFSRKLVGVAIVGRPVARMLDNGRTLEVTRLATDGTKNACSMLYAACWRVARAMGYLKLVTYILDDEIGTSLHAAGWKVVGLAGGGSWSRNDRPRVDKHPTQGKIRFEVTA